MNGPSPESVSPDPSSSKGGLPLRIEHLSKSFGPTRALRDFNLTVASGEIHTLLGHNGSGKSTLVKLLAGYHRPDTGEIFYSGEQLTYPVTATRLQRLGVSFMHQDIGLVPSASVLENLRLMRFETGLIHQIRWRHEEATVRAMLESFELGIDPRSIVGDLSSAERRIIGIIRALETISDRVSGLLVLDEPTVSLPQPEAMRLVDAIRNVAQRGIAVLFVTHHLNEPLMLGGRISVLRDGLLVETVDAGGLTEADLASMVISGQRPGKGDSPRLTPVQGSAVPTPAHGSTVLTVEGLCGTVAKSVSFHVQAGEVVGLSGLLGSGYNEVPYLLFGAETPRHGKVSVDGERYRSPSPYRSRRRGLALVSGDRAKAGGVLPATLTENLSAPVLGQIARGLRGIRVATERPLVEQIIRRFDIRPGYPNLPFSSLSGGNQQKALIGRWMTAPPRVLLLDEPTAGVDIGAIEQIINTIKAFTETGGAAVVSSEQYEDLLRMCDRVLVFRNGAIAEELSGETLTADNLLSSSYGTNTPPGRREWDPPPA